MYTSAAVELLGSETAAASQVLLNVLSAVATSIAPPIAAGLMEMGKNTRTGSAVLTHGQAYCFC